MFQAHESFQTLMKSDKLDDLLAAARSKVAHLTTAQPASVEEMQQLDVEAKVAQENADAALGDIEDVMAKSAERRNEKVAMVLHLARVASRLVG